jgi:hypothetical protein
MDDMHGKIWLVYGQYMGTIQTIYVSVEVVYGAINKATNEKLHK